MHVTRRFWVLAAVGVFLAVAAVLFDRPVLLFGVASVGAWLVTTQYAFAWTLARVDDVIRVDQSVSPERGFTTQQFQVTLSVSAATDLPFPVAATLRPSPSVVGLDADERECTLAGDADEATVTGSFRRPVAGRARFDAPEIRVSDGFGLFWESFSRGEPVTATVEPPHPTDVRIGRGQSVATADGEPLLDRGSDSLVYRSIREYVPTDPANRIDWRATARLGEPQVVEFERHTDQQVALVLDRRPEMAVGDRGRTKFDYCREVALRFVDGFEEAKDPVGLLVFDDEGVRTLREPRSSRSWYGLLRTVLRDQSADADGLIGGRTRGGHIELDSPAVTAQATRYLADDRTDFGRTILPFVASDRAFLDGVSDDALYGAVETLSNRVSGQVVTVLFTDDTRPARVRESVNLARREDGRVLVFLTPTVLFESNGLEDVEEAYERYRSFESFRRELDGLARVRAYEVSPGVRSDTVRAVAKSRQ
jgi:uncharacterized protein (DUF58 family)